MKTKTFVMGMIIGGLVSAGTYFLLPPPESAKAEVRKAESGYYLYDKNATRYIREFRLKTDPNILCVRNAFKQAVTISCVSAPKK